MNDIDALRARSGLPQQRQPFNPEVVLKTAEMAVNTLAQIGKLIGFKLNRGWMTEARRALAVAETRSNMAGMHQHVSTMPGVQHQPKPADAELVLEIAERTRQAHQQLYVVRDKVLAAINHSKQQLAAQAGQVDFEMGMTEHDPFERAMNEQIALAQALEHYSTIGQSPTLVNTLMQIKQWAITMVEATKHGHSRPMVAPELKTYLECYLPLLVWAMKAYQSRAAAGVGMPNQQPVASPAANPRASAPAGRRDAV